MLGTGHRVVASSGWVALTAFTGMPAWQTAAGVIPAVAFSAGITSPDVDNTRLWKKLVAATNTGDVLGHRRLMHWWGLPAVAAGWAQSVGVPFLIWAAIFGWASHVAADCLVGRRGYGTPEGVPLLPWWCHVGAGLKCGGIGERLLVIFAALGAAVVVVWP